MGINSTAESNYMQFLTDDCFHNSLTERPEILNLKSGMNFPSPSGNSEPGGSSNQSHTVAGIITVILILVFSILITRVASIALTHTGLSRESSKFQARSAFTGVGFTTTESEKVVNHPVRRRILLLLMILGNAGINVLAISRQDGSFFGTPAGETTIEDGDTLIVYGRAEALQKLEKRLKGTRGNRQHKAMIRKQQKVQNRELKESQKAKS
jgi:hypothetical protein